MAGLGASGYQAASDDAFASGLHAGGLLTQRSRGASAHSALAVSVVYQVFTEIRSEMGGFIAHGPI